MKTQIRYLISWALFAPVVPLALAQAQSEEEEDIIELSPFSVDASQDQGYYSPSTLAGTRIRTDLKDIGTSIQAVTKDFMEDIGARDAQDLLTYTTNTEVGGALGNYSGENPNSRELNTANSRLNPQSTTRIRGLFQADLTRNYYRTVIPFDSYNTTRVDINRGSNATLFGLGSPAGIINNTVEPATFKNGGEVRVRADSEGSLRGSVNVNQVIIDDVLAVRGAFLKDNRKYYQDPTFQDSTRGYLAANFRVTPSTTIRANYERGNIDANRPDPISPMESISPWLSYGKPYLDTSIATGIGRDLNTPVGIKVDKDGDGVLDDVYPIDIEASDIYTYMQYPSLIPGEPGEFAGQGDFTWDGTYVRGPKRPTLPDAEKGQTGGFTGPGIFSQMVLVYGDPNNPLPSIPGYHAEYPSDANVAGDALSLMGDGQLIFADFQGTPNLSNFYNNFKNQGMIDLNGFDWGKNLLAGDTARQQSDFEAYNIALEQTFWEKKAGIEVSFDYQNFENGGFVPMQFRNISRIQIDVNKRLPDGRENPNFGRPYAFSRGGWSYRNTELKTVRATGYFMHDFGEQFEGGLFKWLGRHTLTGTLDRNSEELLTYGTSLVWDDPDARRVLRTGNDLSEFNSQVIRQIYLGPSVMGSEVKTLSDVQLVPPRGLNLWLPGTTQSVTYWDPGTKPDGTVATDPDQIIRDGKLVTRELGITQVVGEGVQTVQNVTDSQAAVLQSHFLKDHLVTTIGYRKDSVDNDIYFRPPTDDLNVPIISRPLEEWQRTSSSASEDRWSYGAVLHIPQRFTPFWGTQLSVHYAHSSNFQLLPGRVNWNDEPLPNPQGETEEMGFSVSTMDRKLHVRFNWYETSVSNLTDKPSNLAWNLIFQNARNYVRDSWKVTKKPVLFEYNQAVAEALLAGLTPGEIAVHGHTVTRDADGYLTDVTYESVKSPKDTTDVVAKGMEVELTFNPTRSWRMHLNVAKQETVKSNIHPHTESLIALRTEHLSRPIPGFEFMQLGQAGRTRPKTKYTIRRNDDPEGGAYFETKNPDNNYLTPQYNTLWNYMETKMIQYRTAKALDGSQSPEQRKWRINFVTSYRFNEGRLKGLQVGGSYRWQDSAAIGYPLIKDPDTGLTIGDIDNPVMDKAIDSFDFFVTYTLPWFKELGTWRVQARVQNAFASNDDLIPVQVQPDGKTFSRMRLAPQRLWTFSSSFSW